MMKKRDLMPLFGLLLMPLASAADANLLRNTIIAIIVISAAIVALVIYYYFKRNRGKEEYFYVQPKTIKVEEPAEVQIMKMPESIRPKAAARAGIGMRTEAISSVLMNGSEESVTALYVDFKNIEAEAIGRKEAYKLLMQKIENVIEKYHGIKSAQQNSDVLVLFGEKTGQEEPEIAAIKSALEISNETKRNLIKTGFGIHTGSAIMRVDFDRKLRYTSLHSTTQIASRVASRALAGEVVISEAAYAPVSANIQVEKRELIDAGTKRIQTYLVKNFTKREKFKPYVDAMMRRWKTEESGKERDKIWQNTMKSTSEQLAKNDSSSNSLI
jgi:class 3 adenylate cyclase